MMPEISDAALDAYYADIFERTEGYDPLEGPFESEEEESE